MKEISDRYEPKPIEKKWIQYWEENKTFEPNTNNQETFSIVIPPPNVTGTLHIGHALNHTLQDIIIRIERKKGKQTVWVPGMDHAGIATQIVVEKELAKKSQKRTDFSREEFVEKVWEWKKYSGGEITKQQRLLGESVDWSREKFTLDKNFSTAVYRVFKTLHEEGLIYRGKYLVNWDPTLKTAVSDLEVNTTEQEGRLWFIKYQVDGQKDFLEIATTRPETLLGDSALAVHPEDEKYKHLIGKTAIVPIINRKIPIIADSYVDTSFGTACVKITPAHDFNDYEIGKRHNLEMINIFTPEAKMNENTPADYQGLDRFEARKKILQDLTELGLFIKEKKHTINLPKADRTGVVVEPYLTDQWFVKIEPLAKKAIEVVKNGKIEFYPKMWEKIYFEWMENIKDWCISRQLWWGHRIPAYHCLDCKEITVSEQKVSKCSACQSSHIKQDEDVLDTWFSSGLWPFGVFNWPEQTEELKKFYPNSVLVTGFDIIFFWVARMIMLGTKFMDDVPFKKVIIHGLVRDKNRKKFSKSVGNVIDPLVMMDKYGTDSFRFFLAATLPEGKDIIFDESRLEGYRAFCNKIWNSSRFIAMNLSKDFSEKDIDYENLDPTDFWIFSEFNRCLQSYEDAYKKYRFFDMVQVVYDFIWGSFCDWFIEFSKPRVYGKVSEKSQKICEQVLVDVLKKAMGLLHPIMPFITEEIHSQFSDKSLAISDFPKPYLTDDKTSKQNLQKIEFVKEIVSSIRKLRAEMNIAPSKKIEFTLLAQNEILDKLQDFEVHFQNLTNTTKVHFKQTYEIQKTDVVLSFDFAKVVISISDLIDFELEKKRLQKEKAKVEDEISKIQKKLDNPNFMEKAKSEVIEQQKQKLNSAQNHLENILEGLKKIEI